MIPIAAAMDFFGQWYNWLPLTMLAVMTAIIINASFLMIGRAFSIRQLEAFAKSEMLQAAATAFMAIFLVVMVGSAMEVSRQFIASDIICGGELIEIGTTNQTELGQTAMDEAYDLIRCRLQQRAQEIAAIQGSIAADSAAEFAALNSAVSLFGITIYKGDWTSALYKRTETMRIVNNLATVLLIGLNAQSILLKYLQMNMLHTFIPVGILLRSFYFTRSPGALMIALGVGMYFLFPIFYVLLDPGFVPSPTPPVLSTPQVQPYCYATMSNTVSILASLEEAGLGSSADLTMSSMRDSISKSYITLMLHPLVALFLTLIFVRYMMGVLGGDTYELTKMVSKVI